MKTIAGTLWGQDKKTLLLTYNRIIKPILTYVAPIWYPTSSRIKISRLQTIQNKALRIIASCILKRDIQHLHSECQVLPNSDHLCMLSAHFYARALRPKHPSNTLITPHPGPNPARAGLPQTTIAADVAGLIEADGDPYAYKEAIKMIHTNAVSNHLAFRPINRVLVLPAQDISASEADLLRHHHTTLAQLRSAWPLL